MIILILGEFQEGPLILGNPPLPPRAVGTQATIPLALIELAKQGFEMEVEARRAQAVSRDFLKGFLRVSEGFDSFMQIL